MHRVSIHAPRVGCDSALSSVGVVVSKFQFTHPVWGATGRVVYDEFRGEFQFTHPVWGATTVSLPLSALIIKFQFTHPVWGATIIRKIRNFNNHGFNSRTPCGVRQLTFPLLVSCLMFQFTHPVWGATLLEEVNKREALVSIHAPRVGCDSRHTGRRGSRQCFNSRTPCGVRLKTILAIIKNSNSFNSRTPCGVRPDARTDKQYRQMFQFTHPVWGAT